MKRFLLIYSLLTLSFIYSAESPFAFFLPPKNWKVANPSHFKNGIKIGFVQSKRKFFAPSMTLAIEALPCDETTYLKAVEKNHLADTKREIRDLGEFETKSGKAHLMQIDIKNSWGKIRLLQAILIKDNLAYIQTASCLKKDFFNLHRDLLACFHSLTISDDLFPPLEKKRDEFQKRVQKLRVVWKKHLSSAKEKKEEAFTSSSFQNEWSAFGNYIAKNYAHLGPCWQILAIKQIKDELMNLCRIRE